MGYDLTRFVGEIDEEFQCSICSMVFENPFQTSCEHTFCNVCITTWLSQNTTCPIDRKPLSLSEVKPSGRFVRNLLDKLMIKCSFDLEGCEVVVKLEHLQDHRTSCTYNPNSEIICDKGCNMKMRRRKYKAHNCFKNLENLVSQQKDEITKLTFELTIQNENFKKKVIRQERDVTKLREQNTELSNENRRLKEQILNKRPKWRVSTNLHYLYKSQILESARNAGIAQSYHPLGSGNSSFKLKILYLAGDIAIGLSPEEDLHPTFFILHTNTNAICCNGSGVTFVNGRRIHDLSRKWAVGDIIECGIKCPQNLHENEASDIAVYFTRNGQMIFETKVQMGPDQLFPTVYMCADSGYVGSIVKILSN